MSDKGFQGSVANFNSTSITPLTRVDYSDAPSTAPLTGAGDTTEKVGTGMHKESLTVDFIGSKISTLHAGSTGAGVVNLNDGTSPATNFSNAIITKVKVSGRLGSAITGSFTIRPTQ